MRGLSRRALVALTVAVVVVAAAIVVPLVVLGGSGGYRFTLPAGWQRAASAPAGVEAVYERSDHTALLTISSEPRRILISRRFIHGLDAQFRRRLRGYRPLSSRILFTKAGPVFLFDYTQTVGGRLTSILLVPAHGHSYVLDAVVNPTSKAATRDVASIFNSFVPQG